MHNLLEINNVVKTYGNYTALNNVSLQIPKGSIFGLLGPNGAGKTSLIRIINQITIPNSGEVILDGEKLAPHHIEQIGYMPEERGLYKSMKVGEQALYLAQLKGMQKSDAKKKLNYWFEKFEISEWWDKKIGELSKGMAQKVQFIVTVMHEPKLLIFDEPFSGFDPINAQRIAQEILQLRDEGATIIFSTHRMESVEEMCDYIALMHKSNKILDGKLNDIKQQFRTNTFQVEIQTTSKGEALQKLKEEFIVNDANFKSLNDGLQANITLSEGKKTNDLLNTLTSLGNIYHFTEVIPTTNEIFMEAIPQSN